MIIYTNYILSFLWEKIIGPTVAEQPLFLIIRTGQYHHLPMTRFNLHSIGTVIDHKYHWIYLYENQTPDNKLYLLLERKYGLN